MRQGQNGRTAGGASRIAALDGLRGCLAVVVLCSHVLIAAGYTNWLLIPSQVAVVLFFLMSAYVLTRAWDGNYVAFLLRRFIRLWPTYAVCLAAGYLLTSKSAIWSVFLWYPFLPAEDARIPDPPMWSIFLEVWMMPLMPAVIWAATGPRKRAILVMVLALALSVFVRQALVFLLFVAGAMFSHAALENRLLESRIPQWLGKISYSLYLSHVLVIWFLQRMLGPAGVWIAVPLTFVAAQMLWWGIENPSIGLSRYSARALKAFRLQYSG